MEKRIGRRLLPWLGLLLGLLWLCPGWVLAAETNTVVSEGVIYTLDLDAKTAAVTGWDEASFPANGAVVIPELVEKDGGQYTVTAVGKNAFNDCIILTTISISGSVTVLENGAFNNCQVLSSVNLEEGVAQIKSAVFWNCIALEQLYLPATLNMLGDSVFYNCSHLNDIKLAAGNQTFVLKGGVLLNQDSQTLVLCPRNKSGSYSVPPRILSIGENAFEYCSELTELTLGEDVETIKAAAVKNCAALTRLTLGSKVDKLPNDMFLNCFNLEDIEVESGNERYSSYDGILHYFSTVQYCPFGKTGVGVMPGGIHNISDQPFSSCNLDKIIFTDGVTEVDGLAFEEYKGTLELAFGKHAYIDEDAFAGYRGLQTVAFPGGARLQKRAFKDCTGLVSAVFLKDNLSLGDRVFAGCTALKRFELGLSDLAWPLRGNTFEGCNNLTSIVLGCGVDYLEEQPFNQVNCPNLKNALVRTGEKEQMAALLPETVQIDVTPYFVCFDATGMGYGKVAGVTQDAAGRWKVAAPEVNEGLPGYELVGWYADPELTRPWDFERHVVTEDITLYGKFRCTQPLVSFDQKNGQPQQMKPAVAASDGTFRLPEIQDPVKEGQRFCGWYYDDDTSFDFPCNRNYDAILQHINLEAKWRPLDDVNEHGKMMKTYFYSSRTVFDWVEPDADGKYYAQTEYEYDPGAIKGYSFGGWYCDREYSTPWDIKQELGPYDRSFWAKWVPQGPVVYITFDDNNGNVKQVEVAADADGKYLAVKPANPTRSGYSFGGWYQDKACTQAWNFAKDEVNADVILYAKWTKNGTGSGTGGSSGGGGGGGGVAAETRATYKITVTVGSGGKVTPGTTNVEKNSSQKFSITANSGYEIADVLVDGKSIGKDNSYTFKNVTAKHTLEVKFAKIDTTGKQEQTQTTAAFADVPQGSWFAGPVGFVQQRGLMQGVDQDKFDPQGTTSRAMAVTVLYRLADSPEGAAAGNFADVSGNAYYAKAVAWAVEKGIVKGLDDKSFGPDNQVTREQSAVLFYGYAKSVGLDVSQSKELSGFSDGGKVSPWARQAVAYCAAAGVLNGDEAGQLSPQGQATRAEFAAMLQRFDGLQAK